MKICLYSFAYDHSQFVLGQQYHSFPAPLIMVYKIAWLCRAVMTSYYLVKRAAGYLRSGHRSDIVLTVIYDVTSRGQSIRICKENTESRA